MSIRLLSRFTLAASLGFMAAAPAFAQQQLVPAESSIHFVSRQMGVTSSASHSETSGVCGTG